MAKKNKAAEQAVEIPSVMCVVLERFKDKTIGEARRKGDVIMVSEERFAELTAGKQWVAKVEKPAEEEADQPAEGKAE